MISLRVSATKLVNKNEPEEIPKEFPSRRELAMNYTRCCHTFYSTLYFGFRTSFEVTFRTFLTIPFSQAPNSEKFFFA